MVRNWLNVGVGVMAALTVVGGCNSVPELAPTPTKRVVEIVVEPHCEAIEVDEVAVETRVRAIAELEQRIAERSSGDVDEIPAVETAPTWLDTSVVQHILRMTSQHVDSHRELVGYEIDEANRRIVVTHSGAAMETHRDALALMATNAQADITEEILTRSTLDNSDLTLDDINRLADNQAALANQQLVDAPVLIELRPVCRLNASDFADVLDAVKSFDWADDTVPADLFIEVSVDARLGVVLVAIPAEHYDAATSLLEADYGDDIRTEVRAEPELLVPATNTPVPGRPLR